MKRTGTHVRGQLLSDTVRDRAREWVAMTVGAATIGALAGTAAWIRVLL